MRLAACFDPFRAHYRGVACYQGEESYINTGSITSNTIHRVPNRKLISAVLFKVALVLVQIFVKTAPIVPLFLLWSVFDP